MNLAANLQLQSESAMARNSPSSNRAVAQSGASRRSFEKIGIVGLGLIGGSIALAARQLWPSALVIGVDNKDVLETAMRMHAIDVAADDLIVLAEADLVILAAPVKAEHRAARRAGRERPSAGGRHRHRAAPSATIVAAAGALPPRFTFVGGHPLAGAAKGGLEHARPDLFTGRPWLLTAGPATDARRRGARRKLTDVRQRARRRAARDRRAGARSAARVPEPSAAAHRQRADAGRRRRGGAGRSGARRTRSGRHHAAGVEPAGYLADIAATNADEIGPALDALIALLQDLRRDLPTATGSPTSSTMHPAGGQR